MLKRDFPVLLHAYSAGLVVALRVNAAQSNMQLLSFCGEFKWDIYRHQSSQVSFDPFFPTEEVMFWEKKKPTTEKALSSQQQN